MAQPFNRYLRGWLGLLDAKVRGLAPAEFSEVVSPVLDAFPFLLAQTRETVADITAAPGAVGFFAGANGLLVPPADEIWLVEQFTWTTSAALAAADILLMAPALRQVSNGALTVTHVLHSPNPQAFWRVGESPMVTNDRPFVLVPGVTPGVHVQVLAGAPPTLLGSMSFARCRI